MDKFYKYNKPELQDRFRFKLGIFVYQKTGYVTKFILKTEADFIRLNISDIFKEYTNEDFGSYDLSIGDYVSLKLGSWQASVGLYRGSSKMQRSWLGFKIRYLLRKYKI